MQSTAQTNEIKESDFYSRHGFLKYHAGLSVSYWNSIFPERSIKSPSDLRQLAREGEILPYDLYKLRGNGNARQPGKLVLFCFPDTVKSRPEQLREKAIAWQGDGI